MIDFIADNFYYLFLGWLVVNLMQRKYRERGHKKRNATLLQAILIFIIYIGAMVIREEGFEPKWIMIPFALVAIGFYFFRDRILPYKRNCVNCGAKLNFNQIVMFDANLCSNCDPLEQDSSTEEEDDQAAQGGAAEEIESETDVETDEDSDEDSSKKELPEGSSD